MKNPILISLVVVFSSFGPRLGSAAVTSLDTVPLTQHLGMPSMTWAPTHLEDPAAQIPLMASPLPSHNGNANLSFPIRIPDGRQAHQPDLQITYDNEGGKSWLGSDWDLSVSSITVDTRWGVPRYADDYESELYLLDGQQLGPVFHRSTVYQREAERNFYHRKDVSHQQITRHGNNPSNYWWEVRSPDGRIDYYGGRPEMGFSPAHALVNSDGHIVQWQIAASYDIHDNVINYTYQKVTALGGENIYPQTIAYNGREDVSGPYTIRFDLSTEVNRNDAAISYRTGKKVVTDDLLGSITVQYNGELIRQYRLHYVEGQFGLMLLEKIEEYGSNGDFFYDYDFTYYNDIGEENAFDAYTGAVEWSVAKDDIPVGSLSGFIPGYASKPTILGGATTIAGGGGLAITVGPPFNPASKDYSAGPNSTLFTSSSTGVAALVDIDGDGLADKVWKDDSQLFYRKNLLASAGRAAFGPRLQIGGVQDFSKASTFGWTIGAELTAPPVFGAFFHEQTTSTTKTYFADFNGDELLDIASDGTVYFNTINGDGRPTFTTSSTDTPSPIIKGDDVPNQPPTADELEELARRNPLHDVVRSWRAPYSGMISIDGGPQLIEDQSSEAQGYTAADGVICYLQYGNAILVQERIDAGDYSRHDITDLQLQVTGGEEIYFRVSSFDDGLYDQVDWSPTITYVSNRSNIVDKNLLSYDRYDAEQDLLLTGVRDSYIPVDGVADIVGQWQSPALTDTVYVSFSGAIDSVIALPPWQALDTLIGLTNVAVTTDRTLKIDIWSKSNVDWSQINWQPVFTYNSHNDGSSTQDANGNPLHTIYPDVEKAFYQPILPQPFTIAGSSGQLSVESSHPLAPGYYSSYATITIRGSRDTTLHLSRTENANMNLVTIAGDVMVTQGDSIWYDLVVSEPLASIFLSPVHVITIDGQAIDLAPSIVYPFDSENMSQGSKYRGWGQFGYNPIGDLFPIITLPETGVDTTGLAGDTSLVDDGTTTGDLEGSTVNIEDKFIVLSLDLGIDGWKGTDPLNYLSRRILSATRNGRKNLRSQQVGLGRSAPEIIVKTRGNGGFGGLGVGGIEGSIGRTDISTWAEKDIGDFNGDRYPDVLELDTIRYTNFRGSLSGHNVALNDGIHEVFSSATVFGLGRHPANSSAKNAGGSTGKASNKSTARTKSRGRANMSKSKSANKSARYSPGLNGSLGGDRDTAYHTFFDINGDGLEDKVWKNGRVALGTGYDFEAATDWGFTGIGAGESFDAGAGGGFSYSNGSWQGGISVTRSSNHSNIAWVDVNDDALVDQVVISNSSLMVRINTGERLLSAVRWLDIEEIDSGLSVGESANVAATLCLEFLFFRVCFNPSTFAGLGTSGTSSAFQDINGDGYADYLTAIDDDANLTSRNSTVGRTNFLRSVDLPLGGTYTFDYDYRGNTYGLPFSKWVLTSVEITDGVTVDGPAKIVKRYNYADGQYDRHERQLLGFGDVQEYHLSSDGDTLRTIASRYANDNIYYNGLIESIAVIDEDGRTIKETDYAYTFKSPVDGSTLPAAITAEDDARVFPALSTISESLYDESGRSMQQVKQYTYDRYGNIINLTQIDEGNDVIEQVYTYAEDITRYFMTSLNTESIIDNGQRIRHTEYQSDSRGNALEISRWIDDQTVATTSHTYDTYSNVLTTTKPATAEGQRLSMTYTYDDDLHQFITSETDGYGLVQQYTFDPMWQTLVDYTDENDQRSTTTLDAFGRVSTISDPYAIAEDLPFSITYDYHHQGSTPYLVQTYYEEAGNHTLYRFADGLHRNIQDQRSYEFADGQGYIVSGWKVLDDLQRYETYHHPAQSSASPQNLDLDKDTTTPDRETYDVLDRLTSFTDTNGDVTTISYHIVEVNGRKTQAEQITNPLGHRSTNYRDYRGNLVATRLDGPQGDIWTYYTYDGANQILSITDALGHTTTYTYDGLGARLTVETPEGGLTQLTYDAARNLRAKSTTTIRTTINEDEHVRYTYDRERLISIDYPKYFQNRVQLHYGTEQDSFNRKGRVWLIEDATGGREYFFDYAGRVVKEIRTFLINRSLTQTFVTTYDYDNLGRIQTITYPDGEVVTYTYNKGGELYAIEGQRDNHVYPILDGATYDKYRDRRSLSLANAWETMHKYDDKGRLINIDLAASTTSMSRMMTYDPLDNILTEAVRSNADGQPTDILRSSTYDPLQRRSTSEAIWTSTNERAYSQFFDYDDIHNLTLQSLDVSIDGTTDPQQSNVSDYIYDDTDQPTRPSEFGGKTVDYDGNSNALLISSAAIFDYDQHIYDEENRMSGASNNGYKSRYTYDAFGKRSIKSHGSEQGLFVNGAPAGFIEHTQNYRVEVSPFLTFTDQGFYKHYYAGDQRLLTKLGTGTFVSTLSDGPDITAGGIDYKQRIQAYEAAINQYYADLMAPPGPPTLLAISVQPEINNTGLPNNQNSGNFVPPPNWPNLMPPDTTGPPGSPIFYEQAGLTRDNVEPGFNHVDGSITQELLQNYYHYDVDGNVVLVTDYAGTIVQQIEYLPTGAIWDSLQSTPPLLSYAYGGLSLDEETGYYNLGDTYYDPARNINFSADHTLQIYGANTINRRIEGDFFYEYADVDADTELDAEILNSERPTPLTGRPIDNIDHADHEPEDPKVRKWRSKAKRQFDKAKQDKENLRAEFKAVFQSPFEQQEPASPTSFFVEDFGSFTKQKLEEGRHTKRQKKKANQRRRRQQSKRKVRFK